MILKGDDLKEDGAFAYVPSLRSTYEGVTVPLNAPNTLESHDGGSDKDVAVVYISTSQRNL